MELNSKLKGGSLLFLFIRKFSMEEREEKLKDEVPQGVGRRQEGGSIVGVNRLTLGSSSQANSVLPLSLKVDHS